MKRRDSLPYRILAFAAVFAVLMVALHQAVNAEPNTPPSAPNWASEVLVTSPAHEAKVPKVATSADGSRVIVAYQRELNSQEFNNDPYYSESTDGGVTWPAAKKGQPIHVSPGLSTDSAQIAITIDDNNKAHAVWVENLSVAYAGEDVWAANGISFISVPTFPPGAANPNLVASPNNVLDVVWSEGDGDAATDIFHARSTNGGVTFPIRSQISVPGNRSRLPSLAVDREDSGKLYAVWEEFDSPTSITTTIYFSEGTVNAGTGVTTWSTPIIISDPDKESNDKQPKIFATQANGVQVAYDHLEKLNDTELQLVYQTSCQSNCDQPDRWSSPLNVSGSFVTVNDNNPFFVDSTLTHFRACTFIYYHGVELLQQNEQIWGVNSCDNWNGGGFEILTPTSIRAINPSVISAGEGKIYLAYDEVISSTEREIHFLRGQLNVFYTLYLPSVPRK